MARSRDVVKTVAAAIGVAMSSCTIVPMERSTEPDSRIIPCQHEQKHIDYSHEPELLSMSDPEYPEAARAARLEGTVLCHVYVETTGLVANAHVIQSATRSLDEAALQAARTAMFKPALRDDKSKVAVWMVIPVEFNVGDLPTSGGR